MRRMELAGELLAGRFFGGVNSLQFAAPDIARELEAARDICNNASETQPVWSLNAADPASPCALAVDGLSPEPDRTFPARLPTTRLVFLGGRLAISAQKGGRELQVDESLLPPEAELRVFAELAAPRRRAVSPERKIVIARINGITATESPWAPLLESLGYVKDRGTLTLW
jgi:hypothetical protein